jgi:hypothetical protein
LALIKMATACLESSNVTGLANEVAPVGDYRVTAAAAGLDDSDSVVQLGRSTVLAVSPAKSSKRKGRNSVRTTGFSREIRNVAVANKLDGAHGSSQRAHWDMRQHTPYIGEFIRFGQGVGKFAKGAGKGLYFLARRMVGLSAGRTENEGGVSEGEEVISQKELVPIDDEKEVYRRFLRGEVDVDDEDEDADFTTGEDDVDDGSSSSSSSSDVEEDSRSLSRPPPDRDPLDLYADISPPDASILLAHLQQPHITRRRFSQSHAYSTSSSITAARESRRDREKGGWEEEVRRNCVVCTVEPRVIICWPCR